MIAPRV